MMKWVVFLALIGCAASACHREPTLGGETLTCSEDATCPAGMRCYRDICIRNTPPTIGHFDPVFVPVGVAVSVTAVVDDAEGDPLTVTWTQTVGDTLLAVPFTGPALSITPIRAGTTVFSVVVNDGYNDSTVEYLTVAAMSNPPTGIPVFVSDTGTDRSTDCGTADNPCATIAAGLAVGAGLGRPILVAAARGVKPYQHCLDLGANENIWGGFDSRTWAFEPTLRERTVIDCDLDVRSGGTLPYFGHFLAGNARVADLTLTASTTATTFGELDVLITVGFADATGTAGLIRVDVESPGCSAPCHSIGIVTRTASPELLGVNISGPAFNFENPLIYTGMALYGGAPRVAALDGRGEVRLDAAAEAMSTGIIIFESQADIDGMRIVGGISPILRGIEVRGGNVTVRNCDVDLSAFGTLVMFGIHAWSCAYQSTECADDTEKPAGSIENNRVNIVGGSGTFSVSPCLGVAIATVNDFEISNPSPNTIFGNQVTISDDLALSIGVLALGGGIAVDTNTIITGDSRVDDDACSWVSEAVLPGIGFREGAAGIIVANTADGDVVSNNVVTIGANLTEAIGLVIRRAFATSVSANIVDVAQSTGSILGDRAVGALLSNGHFSLAGGKSTFDGNRLRVHAGARHGYGLRITNTAEWHITNNFIYGGETLYSTGLEIETPYSNASWPLVVHNTIHGGGNAIDGLTSRAVYVNILSGVMTLDGKQTTTTLGGPVGIFRNNLLDAGDAGGRRFMFDMTSDDYISVLENNVVQREGSLGPITTSAVLLVDHYDGNQRVHVASAAAGQIMSLAFSSDAAATTMENETWAPLNGRPGPVWVGNAEDTGTTGAIISGLTGAITVAHVDESGFQSADVYSTVVTATTGELVALRPTAITVGEANYSYPPDIAFITVDGALFGASLWAMPNYGWGYGLPQRILPLNAPTLLASKPAHDNASTSRFFIVDNDGVDDVLAIWPGNRSSVPAGVTLPGGPIEAIVATTLRVVNAIDSSIANHGIVAIIQDNAVKIYDEADLVDDIAIDISGAAIPCWGSTPSALGYGFIASYDNVLGVGCTDGEVEIYRLGSSGLTLRSDTGGTPARAQPVESISIRFNRVAVTYAGGNGVDVYDEIVNAGSQLIFYAGYDFLSEVGRREAGLYATSDGWSTNSELIVGTCGLELDNGGTMEPYDLHLVPGIGGGACIDAGVQLPIDGTHATLAADIDGAARQLLDPDQIAPPPPDIGADEQ